MSLGVTEYPSRDMRRRREQVLEELHASGTPFATHGRILDGMGTSTKIALEILRMFGGEAMSPQWLVYGLNGMW